MLLFIKNESVVNLANMNFNTSHVTVYQKKTVLYFRGNCNFNTSHVTVYHFLYRFCESDTFNFNTSHVTVYRRRNTL